MARTLLNPGLMTANAEVSLIVIAIAVSVQTLLMIVGAWYAYRAWTSLSADFERHATHVIGRLDTLADSTQEALRRVDVATERMSSVFASGERVAGAVASVVTTPKAFMLATFAGRMVSRWFSKSRSRRIALPGR